MKNGLVIAGFLGFVSLAVLWQVSLWQECRETNSWGYCMRVLSK